MRVTWDEVEVSIWLRACFGKSRIAMSSGRVSCDVHANRAAHAYAIADEFV